MSDAIMTSWQAQKIVVVSNSEEQDAWTEDTLLAQTLAHYAASSVIDLRGISKANLKNDAVYLLRNIWGDAGFEQARKNVYKVLDNAAVSYINQFTGKADQKGKFYLRDLFLAGYPTIPTFLSATQAFEHPAERFLLKPPFGASGIGIKTATRHDLRAELNNQILIIQPKLDFLHELSFFFIDAQFQYALITKSDRWDLEIYPATAAEIASASQYVSWNPVHGIQRMDFLQTINHGLLLLEIEDWCPYLSLFDVENLPKEKFLENLMISLAATH